MDLRTATKKKEDEVMFKHMMNELVIPVQSKWLNENLVDVSQLEDEGQLNEKVGKLELNEIIK